MNATGSAPYAAIEQVREAIGNDLGLVEMDEPLAALALLQTAIEAADAALDELRQYGKLTDHGSIPPLRAALAVVRSGAEKEAAS